MALDYAIIKTMIEELNDDSLIENILEEPVLRQARLDYDVVTKRGVYATPPDHIENPEFFAYALSKRIFSLEEVEKISFDHGKTSETFMQRYYKKNLLAILRENILNPKQLPATFKENYDPHPACLECR